MQTVRRYTVGLDAAGRSRLVAEEQIEQQGGTDHDLWQSFQAQQGAGPRTVPFHPPPGGTLLRLITLPPPDPAMTEAGLHGLSDGFFGTNDIEHCRVDTSRHPMMHRTPTRDCVMLLQGRLRLLLDDGPPIDLAPFDVVNQGFTNHCWINPGPGPAVFLALMHGDGGETPRD